MVIVVHRGNAANLETVREGGREYARLGRRNRYDAFELVFTLEGTGVRLTTDFKPVIRGGDDVLIVGRRYLGRLHGLAYYNYTLGVPGFANPGSLHRVALQAFVMGAALLAVGWLVWTRAGEAAALVFGSLALLAGGAMIIASLFIVFAMARRLATANDVIEKAAQAHAQTRLAGPTPAASGGGAPFDVVEGIATEVDAIRTVQPDHDSQDSRVVDITFETTMKVVGAPVRLVSGESIAIGDGDEVLVAGTWSRGWLEGAAYCNFTNGVVSHASARTGAVAFLVLLLCAGVFGWVGLRAVMEGDRSEGAIITVAVSSALIVAGCVGLFLAPRQAARHAAINQVIAAAEQRLRLKRTG